MLAKSILFIVLLTVQLSIIFSQTSTIYTDYKTSYLFVTTCQSTDYYDTALLRCSSCPSRSIQDPNDKTRCNCANNTFYYAVNQGGGSLICANCPSGYNQSTDGYGCTIDNPTCGSTSLSEVIAESTLTGSLYTSNPSGDQPRLGRTQCPNCASGTWSDVTNQRCTPCASVTPHNGNPPATIACCTSGSSNLKDGVCLSYVNNGILSTRPPNYNNRFSSPYVSSFFRQHMDTSFYLCRMNLNASVAQSTTRTLFSNVTACQILANIATMQLYYSVVGYAFDLYNTFIWSPTSPQIWPTSAKRPAIPFLAYPSTYYDEINNSSYNWIPASSNKNNFIQMKFAKYSPTGNYLGLVDGYDSYIQLCGGGYTDGKSAFTFGSEFKKTCSIRVDALWSSTLYDTVFFDPYIVFTQSGSDVMLPTPVVIKNYQTDRDTTPNQNDDESKWVYHRRFFLLDRISGVTIGNELTSIHYAKSITILNSLVNSAQYIQPPVIVIEYAELTLTNIGKGATVEISFETKNRMNLDTHIRDIWIAIGVLCGVGIVFSIFQTIIWYSKAGKQTIDLLTIGKFILYIVNAVGTFFFIVLAGVSLWWLIFYKRQDTIFLVIPSSTQQASFTTLIVVAFVLKTIDIIYLIIRQSNIDIFFIDWEKSKTGNQNAVSVWRTYFVANEFNELQTFRRINVTFQLIFVLFFLKVINLENVATIQPGVVLFPSTLDYKPEYNGILRVGIAFSMWLGIAVIQYLYCILIYQRFVEDRIINFVDLCSMSNISLFVLTDNHYGYYIHGQSPHGQADVNINEMMENFRKEKNQKIGSRGLQLNSEDQIFIVRVTRSFRSQYEILLQNYQNRILTRLSKKTEEHESEILLTSYRNLNDFLCKFISHKTSMCDYVVHNRYLLEKILNLEMRTPKNNENETHRGSLFFIDGDRNFTKIIFAGYENSLFIWNMATFLFIDYFAFNYVLAAIITYLINLIAVKIRSSLGRANLSKKTLIPKNFLI